MKTQETATLINGCATSRVTKETYVDLHKPILMTQAQLIPNSIIYKQGKSAFKANTVFLVTSTKVNPISMCGFELKYLQTNKLCPG
jgi:hypothetical protein